MAIQPFFFSKYFPYERISIPIFQTEQYFILFPNSMVFVDD